MVGKESQDVYGSMGSVPDAAPQGGFAPTSGVRSSPENFGGQVGAALVGAGKTGEEQGQRLQEAAMYKQGMINETLATDAETQYTEKLGTLTGQYKSLTGLQANAALPKYTQDVAALRQQYRTNLPAGAAHAFDTLALRHEGYAIGDANSYAATQVKQANRTSAEDSISNTVKMADGSGMDDAHFGGLVGDIRAQSVRMVADSPGFVGQNPDTGAPVFADTPEGKELNAQYDNQVSHAVSTAWVNRFAPLMQQSVTAAYQKYQDDKHAIPPAAQVALDASFAPKLADAHAKNIVSTGIANATNDHLISIATPAAVAENYGPSRSPEPFNLGNVKTSAAAAAGTAGFVRPATPVDGVILAANNLRGGYQGLTLAQIAAKWAPSSENKTGNWLATVSKVSGIPGTDVPDLNDPATLGRLMQGIGTAEKSPQDLAAFTPDIIGQGVEASLSGKHATTVGGRVAGAPLTPPSTADYYRLHYDEILRDHAAQAEAQYPGDAQFADHVRAKTEQHLNDVIRRQELAYKVDNDMVIQAANGPAGGKKPTTMEELESTSPEVKAAIDRMMVNSPQTYSLIENRLLAANSRGMGKYLTEYGTPFLRVQNAIARGEIKTKDQLLQYLPPDENHVDGDFLTPAGYDKAVSLFDKADKDPTEVKIQTAAFDAIKIQYTAANNMMESSDHKGMIAYNNALPLMYKAWEEGRANKVSPYELADPDSKNWVGLATKATWLTKNQQYINAIKADPSGKTIPPVARGPGAVNTPPGGNDTSAFALREAYKAAKTPEQKDAIKKRIMDLHVRSPDETRVLAPVSK